MKNVLSLRISLALACAAILSVAAGGLSVATAGDKTAKSDAVSERDSSASEVGTIPAARPGLLKVQAGAQGPIRSESLGKAGGDPSIRDRNPLTVNGLWETHPGNLVSKPGSNIDGR